MEVIQGFRDNATQDIHNGKNTKAARSRLPRDLWRIATRKLDQRHRVIDLAELRVPPGNNLEAFKGAREGQHSVRINDQYRICFEWSKDGPAAVEVVDYRAEPIWHARREVNLQALRPIGVRGSER